MRKKNCRKNKEFRQNFLIFVQPLEDPNTEHDPNRRLKQLTAVPAFGLARRVTMAVDRGSFACLLHITTRKIVIFLKN